MATLSSVLAWKIPWTEEPGRLQSKGSQRVGHNWAANHILQQYLNCSPTPPWETTSWTRVLIYSECLCAVLFAFRIHSFPSYLDYQYPPHPSNRLVPYTCWLGSQSECLPLSKYIRNYFLKFVYIEVHYLCLLCCMVLTQGWFLFWPLY